MKLIVCSFPRGGSSHGSLTSDGIFSGERSPCISDGGSGPPRVNENISDPAQQVLVFIFEDSS